MRLLVNFTVDQQPHFKQFQKLAGTLRFGDVASEENSNYEGATAKGLNVKTACVTPVNQ